MTWQEDQEQRENEGWRRPGRPGGDWRGLRPTIDNPFSWSLPLGRVAGLSIRLHILFVLFAVVAVAQSFLPVEGNDFSWLQPPVMLAGLIVLAALVLAHEFGHALACRWVGGHADEILLWPLGGLTVPRPPNRWTSHLVSAAGGPAVNAVVCLAAGTWLGVLTGQWLGVALPDPLSIHATLLRHEAISSSWSVQVLFLINWCSLVVLIFNLLPLFPLDGGRVLHALLWPRLGYVRSMRAVVRIGYAVAALLGLAGAILGTWPLLAVAVFGAFVSYDSQKKLEFTEAVLADAANEVAADAFADDGDEPAGLERGDRDRRREALAVELDRILAKIAASGMESLTRRERRLLERETRRRRTGSGPSP